MLKRNELKKAYQRLGSRLVFDLTGDLPYIRGVGPCILLKHPDGRRRAIVLPKMQYDKSRTPFPNRTWPDKLYKSHALGLLSSEESSLAKGLPSISQECIIGPKYIFEGGLRTVEPYFDTLKNRVDTSRHPVVGLNIVEYFQKRFTATPKRFFPLMVKTGQIAVNLEKVDCDYKLKSGDVITSTMHKHEYPVLDLEVEIVHDSDDMLVVSKPSSWPIYPVSNYRFNSLMFILYREHGYRDLRPVHRIDAATSGIVIMAKGRDSASNLTRKFVTENIKKEYLALVDGRFPDVEIIVNKPIGNFRLTVDLWRTRQDKEAVTVFNLLNYCTVTDTSLVSCVPVTGRTHQIRLHLASLGYYIVKDYFYNPRDRQARTVTNHFDSSVTSALDTMEQHINCINHHEETHEEEMCVETLERRLSRYKLCLHCQAPNYKEVRYPEVMCLHSHRYTIGQHVFESKLPSWADHPTSVRINSQHLND